MRFGNWQGVALAFAVSAVLAIATNSAMADGHVIPREVAAVDVNTGGPYYAPPIPYGHYAKDCLGTIHNCIGLVRGCLFGACHKGCGACGGRGCGLCGGSGLCGGNGCGGPTDPSCGGGNTGCMACGGSSRGCGFCHGRGLFRGHKNPCTDPCSGFASTIIASSQAAPAPSAQSGCGVGGCGLPFQHSHHRGLGRGCGLCGGRGCNSCGDPYTTMGGDPCGACGGRGCGLCGGRGLGGNGCSACGGRGCGLCGGGHHLLGLPSALVSKLLHRGEIKYFTGPGGPVPLTPGYVPYVVTTRSPRDYFAFPPFVPE